MDEIVILDPTTVPHHIIASEHREMSDEEFESLKLSIEENGQLVPIITYRGKLVDGRHRQRALIELGINEMKSIVIANNTPLEDVRSKVIGTEMRRTDTPTQKTIRAYKFYKDSHGEYTQEEVAQKFGVSRTSISLAKKLESIAGSETLDKFYENGYVYIGYGQNKKKYTNIQTVIRALKTEAEDVVESKEISESLKMVYSQMSDFAKVEDLASLSMIMNRAKNYIHKLTGA
jgi:transcriptional regulator with XRE-family HTH domain